jgi:hypothetical protein
MAEREGEPREYKGGRGTQNGNEILNEKKGLGEDQFVT